MAHTFTTTATFTRTHAKHLAAKVVADLYQCSVLYDRPAIDTIADYEAELIELLAGEYVTKYEFGFQLTDKRVLAWRYGVGPDGGLHGDDNAGGLYARAQVETASYYNILTPSRKWSALDTATKSMVESILPFLRSEGDLPADGAGYWQRDHGYSAGGILVSRETFRPW